MDDMTEDQRHATMTKIRSKDTKPELALRKELWKRGIRYRKNYSKLPGKPDIAITRYKIAVFVDGEYFHGKDWENGRREKALEGSNPDYWVPKIERNMERDAEVNDQLKSAGWTVHRYWSRDVLKNASDIADEICEKIADLKESSDNVDKG